MLFAAQENPWEIVGLADADVLWLPEAVPNHDTLYETLCTELAWGQERLTLYGREHPVPRLMAWYGDPGARYRYSGVMHEPLPWTASLHQLREQLQTLCDTPFNSVLANWYRDGADCMGRHSDDEPELGEEPVIGSLSLGATRRFLFHRRDVREPSKAIMLTGGSLLLMRGQTQRHWHHSLPRTRKPVGGRINLTFRMVQTSGATTP